jgi:hypothetical protein
MGNVALKEETESSAQWRRKHRIACLLAAIGLFAQSPHCLAAVYKCTGPDGKITYGDTPCAADENGQQITITPEPLHTSPAPSSTQSLPATHSRQVQVQICTAKAFGEWQKLHTPNLQNPHARMEKLSEIRTQCLREVGLLPESQPVKLDPAIECRIQRFNEYLHETAQNTPPQQVLIAKEAEFYEQCKRSLRSPATTASAPISTPRPVGLQASAAVPQRSSSSPVFQQLYGSTHAVEIVVPPTPAPKPYSQMSGPEIWERDRGAQACTNKGYNDWVKSFAPDIPDGDDAMEKHSQIQNECLREFSLPELPPVIRDAVTRCVHRRMREYDMAPGHIFPGPEAQQAKQFEVNDACKRDFGQASTASAQAGTRVSSPATTRAAPIPSPNPTTEKTSAAVRQPPTPATPKVAEELAPVTGKDPSAILNALADRIYVIGETSGKGAEMIAAEASAADAIHRYISSGATDDLLAKEKGQLSPLAAAAYMGYPNVIAALLTSDVVKAHINDAEDRGLTPWIAATLSMRQSVAACNPSIWDDPFKFIPMLVTQPYYIANPSAPYAKTRMVLEKAGATSDPPKAKEVWLTICKNQSPDTRSKVQASTDLQKTVQEVGAAELTAKILELQKKAAEAQKK